VVEYAASEGYIHHSASFREGQHMSRVVTPPTAKPAPPPLKIPHDKIAMRAYEKWVKRGHKPGSQLQDWLEAEAELRAEYGSSTGSAATMSRR
jgi:hypothetical protein